MKPPIVFHSIQPKVILLVTAERIGDALFCTPAIYLLKQTYPEFTFDVLTFSDAAKAIFMGNPAVSRIHVTKRSKVAGEIIKSYPQTINLMHEMLKHIPQSLQQSPIFYSIGKPNLEKHRAQQVMDFVQGFFDKPSPTLDYHYKIYPQKKHQQQVLSLLSQQGVKPQQHILVGCQLGCHRVARRGWKIWDRNRHQHKKVWPLENYAQVAKKLIAHNKRIKFILTGSHSEGHLAKKFLADCPEGINLIGKTSILELAALMPLLTLLLTHDTGTMHFACANQRPLIALFGPTPVTFTGPFPLEPQYRIFHKPTINDITVAEVYEAALSHLE